MFGDRLHVCIRPMTPEDINQVLVMDRLSFPLPWSARTYEYELFKNRNSTMLVVERVDDSRTESASKPPMSVIRRFRKKTTPAPTQLVAYAGFWHVADEVHISTIAVHPDWRGKKLGELLIWTIIREAIRRGATMVTLEVRVSNTVALNLYHKYGFEIVGQRRGYYRDNGEDAHMMTVRPLDETYQTHLAEFGKELAKRLSVTASRLKLAR